VPEETPVCTSRRRERQGRGRTGANEGSEGQIYCSCNICISTIHGGQAGVQIRHLSESEPSLGGQGRARCRRPPKPDILLVTPGRIEGRWAMKEATSLPGEGPSILGRCNYDTLSPLIAHSNQNNLWSLGCSSARNLVPIMISTPYQRRRKGIRTVCRFALCQGFRDASPWGRSNLSHGMSACAASDQLH